MVSGIPPRGADMTEFLEQAFAAVRRVEDVR
jgi:hypothetical protein